MSSPGITRSRGVTALQLIASLAALAIAASFAPPRVKLILLFPVAIGAVAGWLVARFLGRAGVPRRAIVGTAVFLVPLTLVLYAAGSFLVWRQARGETIVANLLAQPGGKLILDQIRSGVPASNASEAEMLDAYRIRMRPPVSAYLSERLKGMPVRLAPTGAAFGAAGELLLGWIAGVVAAAIFASRREGAEASV